MTRTARALVASAVVSLAPFALSASAPAMPATAPAKISPPGLQPAPFPGTPRSIPWSATKTSITSPGSLG